MAVDGDWLKGCVFADADQLDAVSRMLVREYARAVRYSRYRTYKHPEAAQVRDYLIWCRQFLGLLESIDSFGALDLSGVALLAQWREDEKQVAALFSRVCVAVVERDKSLFRAELDEIPVLEDVAWWCDWVISAYRVPAHA